MEANFGESDIVTPDFIRDAAKQEIIGDAEATRRLGVEVATGIIERLLDIGVPGIHLYAMNRAQSIEEIYDNLGLRR